jgi:hypothetical protein
MPVERCANLYTMIAVGVSSSRVDDLFGCLQALAVAKRV